MTTTLFVVIYLVVLVMANLAVHATGQAALLVTGVMLVPLDFAVRVRLQELWKGPLLWSRLIALMVAGAVLTIAVLPDAIWIATSSVSAFLLSSLAGAWTYLIMDRQGWHARAWSLASMAIVDSIVFPVLAFDSVSLLLVIGQCLMKWVASLAFLALINRRLS